MGKLSYLFNDYIKDIAAGNISLTNEDANYPTENSQDEQVALTTRTTAKVAIKYRFELPAAKKLQAFFIGNHNFSGGTFDINQYTAAWAVKTIIETKTVRLLDVYHREAVAPANARTLWEFDFTNVTTADTYLEFGRAMAYDDLVQITDIEDYIKPRGYGFRNIINETKFGVRHSHELAEKRERFEIAWGERLMTTLPSELRTLYEAVHGDAHPFLYIPDIDLTACYYCYMEDPELLWAEIMGVGASAHVGQIILRIIEAVRGKS